MFKIIVFFQIMTQCASR